MTKLGMAVAALCLVACGSDPEPPPSCQQAVGHYYGSGCSFFDLSTSPPTPYSELESVASCKEVNAAVPERCQAEFDDLMYCLDSTPANASTGADCDCSQEQDALFGCD